MYSILSAKGNIIVEKNISKPRKAIYAGSFDPPTNGHAWMIRQGAQLFDELEVAVGVNPAKRSSFTLKEKMAALEEITRPFGNVQVGQFENQFLVDYARARGCTYILRGLRSVDDFRYEQGMGNINRNLNPAVQTVYLIALTELEAVSSGMVKSLVGSSDWEKVVAAYVPPAVLEIIIKHHKATGKN